MVTKVTRGMESTHLSTWGTLELREIVDRIREKNQGKTENVLTISAQHGLVSQTEFFNKSVASKNLDGYYYLEFGDFAYNKSYSDGYPYGAIKRLERYGNGVLSTLYHCFRPKEEIINSNYLKFYFDSNLWHDKMHSIAPEGGRSHGLLNVGVDDFFGISLTIPPLPEQRKIAAILSSVDDAISKTEVIIMQTEQVKQGLMQQLLMKGIGHTTFKQTEIGEIPVDWTLMTLGDIGELRSGSTPSRAKQDVYFSNGSIPWVKTLDLNNSVIYSTQENITKVALKETSCKIIPKGSVLVAMYGGFNQIGRTGLLGIDATINQALTAIEIDTNKVLADYVLHWLNFMVKYWENFAASSRKDPNITKSDVRRFPIAIPSLAEQVKVSSIISSVENNITIESTKLNRLKAVKQGLMTVLLSGKVRVNTDENAEVAV
jgi:type I restriction enzyme S subunit